MLGCVAGLYRKIMSVANSSSANSSSIDQARLDVLAFCEANQNSPYVYAAALPIWLVFLVWWSHDIYFVHRQHAHELHHMLWCIPALSAVFSLLSICYYEMCPWDLGYQQLVSAAWVVLVILREPVFVVCLLMVAKGWRITRNDLAQNEIALCGTVVLLLYATVTIQLSIGGLLSAIPQLLVWFGLLVVVLSAVITNLRVLKAQLLALRSFNIDATTTPAFTKYSMFAWLLVFASIYFGLDITLFALAAANVGGQAWLWHALCRQILELALTISIGWIFRARPFNVLFEQVQQLVRDVAGDMLPQLSTVNIDVAALRGDGTVPWSREMRLEQARGAQSAADGAPVPAAATPCAADAPSVEPPPMLLVLNPTDKPDELLHRGIVVVAVRLTSASHGPQASRPPVHSHSQAPRPTAPVHSHSQAPRPTAPADAGVLPLATLRELLQSSAPWHGHTVSLSRVSVRGSSGTGSRRAGRSACSMMPSSSGRSSRSSSSSSTSSSSSDGGGGGGSSSWPRTAASVAV